MNKIDRNDPCPCSSGKKYKNCCLGKASAIQPAPLPTMSAPTTAQLLQLALQHHQTGRLPEAEAIYRQILQIAPDNADALHFSGLIAYQTGRNDTAVELITQAIRLKPSAKMYYNLGNVLRDQGKPDAAADSFRQALSIQPDYPQACNNLGNALQTQGKLGEAASSYRQALALKADYAEAHNNLGIVLRAQGEFNAAADSYRRALSLKPNFADAHYNLGNAHQDQGLLDTAAECYRRALSLKPDYAEAYSKLGRTLDGQGNLDEAVFSYRKALSLKPDDAETHTNLGIALKKQGKLDEAIDSYRRALSLNPDYADAYGHLGAALGIQGKLDEALTSFRQVIRLMPDNAMALHQIASLTGSNTERAPSEYVENVFDGYADKFDTHLQQGLQYDIPAKMAAFLTQHSAPSAGEWNVLDLGCGTGLAGLAIAPFARSMVGVDLSAKMLEKAHARNLYQRLEHADLLTIMQNEKVSSYDVIIAADVFVYIGKLDEIVHEIKRLLCPGGIFAFSVESLDALPNDEADSGAPREYRLENTGRYTHSAGYLNRLASANNFRPKEMAATRIRVEHGKPVAGYLVLWEL